MMRELGALATVGGLLIAACCANIAFAQKQGGILRMSHFDSPASMSMHEEATAAANRPMMGVFNNLVMYKQDVPQNSMQSIVPDLAAGENGLDDPDQQFYESYVCGAERNYGGYCNPQLDELIDRQSMGARPREAPATGLGDRTAAGRGQRSPGDLLRPSSVVPAAAGKGADSDGQQHLQRVALRRPLARPVTTVTRRLFEAR